MKDLKKLPTRKCVILVKEGERRILKRYLMGVHIGGDESYALTMRGDLDKAAGGWDNGCHIQKVLDGDKRVTLYYNYNDLSDKEKLNWLWYIPQNIIKVLPNPNITIKLGFKH